MSAQVNTKNSPTNGEQKMSTQDLERSSLNMIELIAPNSFKGCSWHIKWHPAHLRDTQLIQGTFKHNTDSQDAAAAHRVAATTAGVIGSCAPAWESWCHLYLVQGLCCQIEGCQPWPVPEGGPHTLLATRHKSIRAMHHRRLCRASAYCQ